MALTRPFAACGKDDVSVVGGKATGLGELERAGFPVPPGFVVTTEAYRLAIGPIRDAIALILEQTGTPAQDQRASDSIAALFAALPLPSAVAAAIDEGYRSIGADDIPVAVRSSATAEDAADASYAGQQDSYLWIIGADAVRANVLRCWASLFTARAIGYRARLGAPLDTLAMGVVVQRMVAAEAAGVMMTLDPVSGDTATLQIESAFGLGEAIVRGVVTPDSFVVTKAPVGLARRTIARKTLEYRFVAEDGAVAPVPIEGPGQESPSLSDEEVLVLAGLGCRVEAHFGRPMDVEWAIDGERRFFLVQARPETVWSNRAPAEAPEAVIGRHDAWDPLNSDSAGDDYWTTSNIGEAAPGVQTPLSWTVWWPVGEDCQREASYRLGAFTAAERRTPTEDRGRCFNQIFYGRLAMRLTYLAMMGDRLPGTTGPDTIRGLFGRVPEDMVFHATTRRYPIIAARLLQTFITMPGILRRLRRETSAWWTASIDLVPTLDLLAATALFAEAKERFRIAQTHQIHAVLGTVQPMFVLLDALARQTGVAEAKALGGVSGNAEMAVVCDLWEVSRGRRDIADVRAEHGFHGPAEGELSSRVWREDDTPLRRMAAQYANRPDDHDPRLQEAAHQRERNRIEKEVIAATPFWRRWQVRLALRLARKYLPLRGVAKKSFLQAFDVMRASARRIGVLRAADGSLLTADDIFYLTAGEVLEGWPANARDLVAKRRARRDAYQQLEIPSSWQGMPDARLPSVPQPLATTDVLQGIGVSRGVVEGRARVFATPDFSTVEPGEILVAPTTDPSWSSIMFVSAGLVVDIGGALSHAAVVARELGIPCVVNTRHGTRTIRTGDWLRVDGEAGTIHITCAPLAV